MMLTKLDMQFIEVAARELLALRGVGYHLSGYRGDCNDCQGSGIVQRSFHYELADFPCPYVGHSEWALKSAASLLGRLLERNGVRSIDEIIMAAEAVQGCDFVDNPEDDPAEWSAVCEVIRREHDSEDHDFQGEFDTTAFFRAVAIEAMGGAKWTSEHRVLFGCNSISACGKSPHEAVTGSADSPARYFHVFSVPFIKQEIS